MENFGLVYSYGMHMLDQGPMQYHLIMTRCSSAGIRHCLVIEVIKYGVSGLISKVHKYSSGRQLLRSMIEISTNDGWQSHDTVQSGGFSYQRICLCPCLRETRRVAVNDYDVQVPIANLNNRWKDARMVKRVVYGYPTWSSWIYCMKGYSCSHSAACSIISLCRVVGLNRWTPYLFIPHISEVAIHNVLCGSCCTRLTAGKDTTCQLLECCMFVQDCSRIDKSNGHDMLFFFCWSWVCGFPNSLSSHWIVCCVFTGEKKYLICVGKMHWHRACILAIGCYINSSLCAWCAMITYTWDMCHVTTLRRKCVQLQVKVIKRLIYLTCHAKQLRNLVAGQ